MSGETQAAQSGWTVDTLHELVLNLREGDQTALRAALSAQEKAVETAQQAYKEAVAAALLAAKEAVQKAEVATEKRFDLTRTETDTRLAALGDKMDDLVDTTGDKVDREVLDALIGNVDRRFGEASREQAAYREGIAKDISVLREDRSRNVGAEEQQVATKGQNNWNVANLTAVAAVIVVVIIAFLSHVKFG